MRRSLIIVGASVRAAAFSAARAGFAPYAIDLFADCDVTALCPAVRIDSYPFGFLRALAEAPDAPWMYSGGLENHPRLVARMAGLRRLWGNPAPALAEVRNPRRLAEVLREEGLPCPELWPGPDPAGRKWLVKPVRGSAGLGVRLATTADLVQPPRGTVLQEYIEGASCSATFVAAGGRAVLLGATQQIIGRDWGVLPEFLYVGSLGPLELTDAEHVTLSRLGNALARRFSLVGLFGVDFLRTADRLWPIEVNPRYTASIEVLERITGQHFFAHHAAACETGMLPESPNVPRGIFAGKAVVYARRACSTGSGVFGGNQFSIMADPPPPKTPDPIALTWPTIADLPPAGASFQVGQPVATVFATGDSLDAVAQQLRSNEAALLAMLAPYQPQR